MSARDILVVGAGLMGMGIAQVAAQSGHRVFLFDQREGAAFNAVRQIEDVLWKLVTKSRIEESDARKTIDRLIPVPCLADARSARVAIEAIVEKLEPKRALLRELESLLGPTAILATNTSSISVTALAAGLEHPERVVGMHFFNPVPLMALVEVVSGLRTAADAAAEIERLARAWGKVPVHARSTPGFIVNRIARPFYAESLMLLQEQAAKPHEIDGLLRAAGFRMGPCELMDLIGHDTNFAVTQSVFEANFFDRRFTPSLVQRELVEGGLLGRKSGEGFYSYPDRPPVPRPRAHDAPDVSIPVSVHGEGRIADGLHAAVSEALRRDVPRVRSDEWTGLMMVEQQLRLTNGRPAWQIARESGYENIAVFDEFPTVSGAPIAYAAVSSEAWRESAAAWLQLLGFQPVEVADTPALIVARTQAMLVNEAADAVLQGVCTPHGADVAMKLGVNYPQGPFEWMEKMGAARVVGLIEALDESYRGERYRVSRLLRHLSASAPV